MEMNILTHLVEGTFMPILLQELLLTLRFLTTALFSVLQILFQPLVLGQCSPSFYFLTLEFSPYRFLLVTLYSSQFTQAPCFELALGV